MAHLASLVGVQEHVHLENGPKRVPKLNWLCNSLVEQHILQFRQSRLFGYSHVALYLVHNRLDLLFVQKVTATKKSYKSDLNSGLNKDRSVKKRTGS